MPVAQDPAGNWLDPCETEAMVSGDPLVHGGCRPHVCTDVFIEQQTRHKLRPRQQWGQPTGGQARGDMSALLLPPTSRWPTATISSGELFSLSHGTPPKSLTVPPRTAASLSNRRGRHG
jgi:hypothetical protein